MYVHISVQMYVNTHTHTHTHVHTHTHRIETEHKQWSAEKMLLQERITDAQVLGLRVEGLGGFRV